MKLLITTEPGSGCDCHIAKTTLNGKTYRATSTCSQRGAAWNLAKRLLIGPNAHWKVCQEKIKLEPASPVSAYDYEAELTTSLTPLRASAPPRDPIHSQLSPSACSAYSAV